MWSEMMKRCLYLVTLGLLLAGSAPLMAAGAVEERLAAYQAQGAGPFDAERGEAMWSQPFTHSKADKPRRCATCHTVDTRAVGEHARTGKAIRPLAPSVNPERLTDAREIEKWFMRNCKWTMGRECTAQEKGDFLSYLQNQ
jgi:mono/diheme cytochrome c family protein